MIKGFTALLLTQRFLKIRPCTPIRENSLIPLALGIDQGGRLLQQVAEQDGLPRIRILLIPHLRRLGVADGLCDSKVSTRFAETSEVRIHLEKNLLARISEGESGLLLCNGGLLNPAALRSPIPRLPREQGADGRHVLRQKIDVPRAQVARLDGDIGDVMRLLAPGRQLGLTHAICSQLHFRAMFERGRAGSSKVFLFEQWSGNVFYRKLRLHAAS